MSEAEILALTNEWYVLVGQDTHKDRDCHFSIEKRWSYGQEPVYIVSHYGYVAEVFECVFNNAGDAHRFLTQRLKENIEDERRRD